MTEEHTPEAREGARHELELEISEYLEEKERIREILGRIGGTPTKREKAVNMIFLILVGISFGVAMVIQDPKNLPLEAAILLVSLKLIFVVTQNARLNHSQFWMLSTIEWRLNEIAKRLSKMERGRREVSSDQ